MGDDADLTIEEKRVYGDRAGNVTVFVATGMGVATVDVSDDLVGEFSLAERCDARDIAALPAEATGRIAVATAEDVLVVGSEGFDTTHFGPAVAVGGDPLLAAQPNGAIARREDDEWIEVGHAGDVHAISGDLVATNTGVYQVNETGLRSVGLSDVQDVAAAGLPHAATASGLYKLGNGWMDVLDGEFRVVASDPITATPTGLGRAHAATPTKLFEHDPDRGVWSARDLPVKERIVDVAYGPATYAITDAGTLLVDAGEGWRHQPIGLRDPRALAVPVENA